MNLVQKLPIGLSLACLMFMSSCSKENALTPEPQMESVNAHSSLKENGPVISLPYFPSTKGSTGLAIYPTDWSRKLYPSQPDNSQILPTGTSSFSHLWGNPLLPWEKALPAILSAESIVNSNSIVTLTTNQNSWWAEDGTSNSKNLSKVAAKIKNLKPWKIYSVTFYVASTICNTNQGSGVPAYAKYVQVNISNPATAETVSSYIDLTGKKAEWIKKTVTFSAKQSEMELSLSALTAAKGQYSYVNVYVDKNSIKEGN